MSIILKGIDIPETNEIRMIAINSKGKVFFNTVKDGVPDKPEISQAIQVPKEHGRLVDADKVIDNALIESEREYLKIVLSETILEAED